MVPVPEMGDSITEGTILEWVKEVWLTRAFDSPLVKSDLLVLSFTPPPFDAGFLYFRLAM